jgi:HEAT repeat protein
MEPVKSRILSIQSAVKRQGPEAASVAAMYLKDPHPRVRREAAVALGRLKDTNSAGWLADALSDKDRDVREAVLAALLRLGEKSVEDPVIRQLGDTDPGIRIGALTVLAKIGTEHSLMPVTRLCNDPFFDVRDEARRAREQIIKRNGE